MSENKIVAANKGYIISVSVLSFILPVLSAGAEMMVRHSTFDIALAGKWFIFYAVGIRLLAAGLRQIKNPAFTAKEIFHIQSDDALPIVRELGFANLCFGLIGVVSLCVPQWRMVSAFGSGMYYGLAGIYHFIKKPAGVNEQFALITDMIIFVALLVYFIGMM